MPIHENPCYDQRLLQVMDGTNWTESEGVGLCRRFRYKHPKGRLSGDQAGLHLCKYNTDFPTGVDQRMLPMRWCLNRR